jgi:hypothetical protein
MNALLPQEEAVLAEGREWTRGKLEERLQQEINRWGALCPRARPPLERRKKQRLKLSPCAGPVVLKTWRGYSPALGRWLNPTRARWGLKPRQRRSPELQSRLGFTATQTGSYQKAAVLAGRWGTPISDDTVQAVVQQLGQPAQVKSLPPPACPAREPEFSLVLMMDGWMVRERGVNWGASRRRLPVERGNWKEVKSAVIYRLEQRVEKASGRGMLLEKFVVACVPDTDPVDFGAAVQAEAQRRGLARAQKVYGVIDGAVWLWALTEDRFKEAIKLLDFHPASEPLWAVAQALYGEGTPEARAWVEPLVHHLRHGKEAKVVRTLAALLEPQAHAPEVIPDAVRTRGECFRTHRDHLHYQQVAHQGGPIGSGSVESLNSQFQDRFKRTGPFWTRLGFGHLIRLDILIRNQDYDYLGNGVPRPTRPLGVQSFDNINPHSEMRPPGARVVRSTCVHESFCAKK